MTDEGQQLSRRYGLCTVAALVLTSFIPLSLSLSCAGIFYPYVAPDLGVGVGLMSYYNTFIWLSATIFLSLMGKILQRVNARIVLTAAVGLISVTFVWLSFAGALWQFYAGAFVMGLGIGMLLFLAPSTLINRWFAKRAGFYLGIVMAFTGVGGVVWSALGGTWILEFGWAFTYRIFAVLSAVTLLATLFLVQNNPQDKELMPVGFDETSVGSEGEGARASEGISASKAFKMPSFFLVAALAFLLNFGMYVYFMIPSYVNTMDIAVAMPILGATASSVAMAGQTISKLAFGVVGEKTPYACVIVGLALGVGGIVLLALNIQQAVVIYLAALIFGVYYGVTNVMSPIITRLNFGNVDYPQIYSRISTAAAVANMVAALIWGALIDITGGFMVMFVGVGILLVATMGVTLMIKKTGCNGKFQEEHCKR